MERTWDGLPVAQDQPHGAMVVVRRPGAETGPGTEYLVLHRAHRGPAYEGDWAWTPPSGARQPGEPVLAGALRELGEEAGLGPAELRPVYLSGGWVVFVLDVPAGTGVRLDAEHDRFAWLPAAEAERRCRPAVVLANLRRAAAVPAPAISFRPLAPGDLAHRDLVLVGGRDAGVARHYPLRDQPAAQAAGGATGAIGIDYQAGDTAPAGRGVGPQLIWAYLQQVVFPAWPAARLVAACPAAADHRSLRALEEAGFSRVRVIAGERDDQPRLLCTLDRQRIFGAACGPAG